jgi:hypothetical protein
MRVLAEFAMQGRIRAIAAVGAFGILGLFFPPLSLLAGAVVGLVALRVGSGAALTVAAFAALLLGVVLLLTGVHPFAGILGGLAQWLPVIALAQVLRATVSWRITLAAGSLVAGSVVFLLHLVVPNLEAQWIRLGLDLLQPFLLANALDVQQVTAVLTQMAPYLTGLLAGMFLLGQWLSLLLARYWQALLYNPGAFGTEFRQLQLGHVLGVATGLLALAGYGLGLALALQLAFLLAIAFFLQGLAIAHALRHDFQLSAFWLTGLYVLLFFALPQLFLLLTLLGIIDSVVHLRRRWVPRHPTPPDAGQDP